MNKIYFLTIFFLLLIIGCDDNINNTETPLNISAKFVNSYEVSELKSFKIEVWKNKNSSDNAFSEFVKTTNCVSLPANPTNQDRRIAFNLDENEYQFRFYGSVQSDCATPDWVGKSVATVKKMTDNNPTQISILVSKKDSISLSTLNISSARAFFTGFFDAAENKIFLAGGSDSAYNRMKRLTDTKCSRAEENCVCFDETDDYCYVPIDFNKCMSLMGENTQANINDCNACLIVENNKFTAFESTCTVPCNKSLDSVCYLRPANNIIEINTLERDSNFIEESPNTTPPTLIKLLQPKIGGKFIKVENKYYHIGGVPMVEFKNQSPYYFPIRYPGYEYSNVMWSNLEEQFKDVNLIDKSNILIDNNILVKGSEFIVIGGSITGYYDNASDFNNKSFTCNNDTSSCNQTNFDKYEIINNIGGSVLELIDGDSDDSNNDVLVYGGITYPLNNNNSFIMKNNGTVDAETEKSVKTFRQNILKIGSAYYSIGGFNYTTTSGKAEMGEEIESIQKIDLTDLSISETYTSDYLKNLIFPEYLEGYGSGFLIIGGLDISTKTPSDKIIYFNPSESDTSKKFTVIYTLKHGRFGHKVYKDQEGRIWIIGGLVLNEFDQFVLTGTIEIITPKDFIPEPKK